MSRSNVATVFTVARESETHVKLKEETSPEKAAWTPVFSSPRRLNATGPESSITVRHPSRRGVASCGTERNEHYMSHDLSAATTDRGVAQ